MEQLIHRRFRGLSELKNTLEEVRKQLFQCCPGYVKLTQFSKSLGFFPSVQ